LTNARKSSKVEIGSVIFLPDDALPRRGAPEAPRNNKDRPMFLPRDKGNPASAVRPHAAEGALVARVAGAVVRFDALACLFPGGFETPGQLATRQVAERVKLLSESLRMTLLMERAIEEAAETGAQLLVSMRQLHRLGRTTRLHQSHRAVLRLGLGLVEQIVKGLRELAPPAGTSPH
jgi:hypothetical protein